MSDLAHDPLVVEVVCEERDQDVGAYWNAPEATDAVLHELGHAMGLAHPVAEPPAFDPKNAVMDPAETLFLSYQPGDLCGLYEIVWRAPCAGSAAVTLGQGVVSQ